MLGEVQGATDRIPCFYGEPDRPLLHLPLNFALLDTPWQAYAIDAAIDWCPASASTATPQGADSLGAGA